jgi:hypothetical protein
LAIFLGLIGLSRTQKAVCSEVPKRLGPLLSAEMRFLIDRLILDNRRARARLEELVE